MDLLPKFYSWGKIRGPKARGSICLFPAEWPQAHLLISLCFLTCEGQVIFACRVVVS